MPRSRFYSFMAFIISWYTLSINFVVGGIFMNKFQIPKNVLEEIEYQIARCYLNYPDNLRAYRVSDRYGKPEFIASVKTGCCRFWEGSALVDGELWVIGCNYGH